jgi:precorrin-4/cobalt-precorrin-4 C11-methyltransferase
MKVYFVGAGPGDPELLTRKAERLLRSCSFCIYAGSLVSPAVVGLVPDGAEKHDSARLNLEEILELCDRAKARGLDVVRLHTGDPSLYGAIGEQMNALDARGIDYEVVPGVSSFQAAAATLKLELTMPEVSQTVILTRAAGRTPVPDEQDLERLGATKSTLCIFLSVQQIGNLSETLMPHYGADCPAAVVYRASWPDELVVKASLAELATKVKEAGITKTAMVIVGQALGRQGPVSKLYDATFDHGHRPSSPS